MEEIMSLYVGPFPEEFIRQALDMLAEVLRDPTCQISIDRGCKKRANLIENIWDYETTLGRTITLEIHGGAKEETEPLLETLQRNLRPS
jgi:hypothetical protein